MTQLALLFPSAPAASPWHCSRCAGAAEPTGGMGYVFCERCEVHEKVAPWWRWEGDDAVPSETKPKEAR